MKFSMFFAYSPGRRPYMSFQPWNQTKPAISYPRPSYCGKRVLISLSVVLISVIINR